MKRNKQVLEKHGIIPHINMCTMEDRKERKRHKILKNNSWKHSKFDEKH